METYEVLERAKALIEDKSHWCQGTLDDGHGRHCAEGAVHTVCQDASGQIGALEALALHTPCCIVCTNDQYGHKATMEAFAKAIRDEKSKAGVVIDLPEKEPEYANV